MDNTTVCRPTGSRGWVSRSSPTKKAVTGPQLVRTASLRKSTCSDSIFNVSLSRNIVVISPITNPSAAMTVRPLKFASDSRMCQLSPIHCRSRGGDRQRIAQQSHHCFLVASVPGTRTWSQPQAARASCDGNLALRLTRATSCAGWGKPNCSGSPDLDLRAFDQDGDASADSAAHGPQAAGRGGSAADGSRTLTPVAPAALAPHRLTKESPS